VAALEGLDNLTLWSLNLQRLDVRCAATARSFRNWSPSSGRGLDVIKVCGAASDALLHADRDGALVNLMTPARR